jgi:protein arginine N-methyltransferase 5
MNGNFIVVMAGAGRGGILSKIIEAAKKSKIKLKCIAVEKNPYAYLTLKYIQSQQKDW